MYLGDSKADSRQQEKKKINELKERLIEMIQPEEQRLKNESSQKLAE